MNPWQARRYIDIYKSNPNQSGIKIRFYGIDQQLKMIFKDFTLWLQKQYSFPIRINVKVTNKNRTRLKTGEYTYGLFRYESMYEDVKMIIPTGGYNKKWCAADILSSYVHELTHYMQWINQFDQDDNSSERQANYHRYRILDKYIDDISVDAGIIRLIFDSEIPNDF